MANKIVAELYNTNRIRGGAAPEEVKIWGLSGDRTLHSFPLVAGETLSELKIRYQDVEGTPPSELWLIVEGCTVFDDDPASDTLDSLLAPVRGRPRRIIAGLRPMHHRHMVHHAGDLELLRALSERRRTAPFGRWC